jgi:hypothetical protein
VKFAIPAGDCGRVERIGSERIARRRRSYEAITVDLKVTAIRAGRESSIHNESPTHEDDTRSTGPSPREGPWLRNCKASSTKEPASHDDRDVGECAVGDAGWNPFGKSWIFLIFRGRLNDVFVDTPKTNSGFISFLV